MALSKRRDFLKTLGLGAAAGCMPGLAQASDGEKPNFIIIFADDLGYGDLSCFGHPTIRTPYLDGMAHEGQKWTSFYAAASVCTPSRAGIMTGRLPIRSGMCGKRRVLFPDSARGLPAREVTIAEALKPMGYATGCIGKWHLGHLPPYLPTNNGFDSYYGIPYSNDMDRLLEKDRDPDKPRWMQYNLPLMQDLEVIERPVKQTTLTKRYNEKACEFIRRNKDRPFFLYLAHNLPHIPLFTSDEFRDTSRRGLFGDVVEEIDWGVGQILSTLRTLGIDDKTMVIFTSDNGPWLPFKQDGGSAGPLRMGKGTTWEGGMREPTIFWMPGHIQPGVVQDMGSTMDLLPTFCHMAGAKVPDDRIIDGVDLQEPLLHGGHSPRDNMFYYRQDELYAVRLGSYKAHYITQGCYGQGSKREEHDPPLLFNIDHDPSEKYNIADKHPDVIAKIAQLVKDHRAKLIKGEPQLEERIQG